MQHQLFYELLLLLLLNKNVIKSKAGYRSRQELGFYAIPPAVAATDADLFSFCTLKMQLIRSTAFLTSDAAASEASAADFAAATRGQHYSDNRKLTNLRSCLMMKCKATTVLPLIRAASLCSGLINRIKQTLKVFIILRRNTEKLSSPFAHKLFPRLCSRLTDNHQIRCLIIECGPQKNILVRNCSLAV